MGEDGQGRRTQAAGWIVNESNCAAREEMEKPPLGAIEICCKCNLLLLLQQVSQLTKKAL
jgi:hypothetical protein